MFDHMMNDSELLEVFFSEIGFVGLDEVEEPADHLYNAVEVPRSHLAFHDLIESVEIEGKGGIHLFGGVHFFGCRSKDEICADRLQQFGIPLYVSRIFGEIFLVVELCRIDEDGDEAHIVVLHRSFNEAGMSRVKRSHRRYQTDGFTLCFASANDGLQFFFRCDDLHIFLSIKTQNSQKSRKVSKIFLILQAKTIKNSLFFAYVKNFL